jgi:geranylgeranyl pyrophosphate synthase
VSDSHQTFVSSSQKRFESVFSKISVLGSSTNNATGDQSAGILPAMSYTLLNGGKRIRPVLTYSASAAINSQINENTLDHPACAIELIHTYSLIHDDLPAMDDDDLRRGKPSCHKAFDEATAILAGDALHSRAFELLADAPGLSAEQRVKMIKVLAAAAGPAGMVGGQAIDIAATDSEITLSQLQTMHEMKTGALIRAALALGGIASGASQVQLTALDNYGRHIGLAFQVADDILDVESDSATLGKTQGKDAEANKPTYVKLMGLEGAKSEAQRLLAEALASLDCFGESADHLRDLARYIIERKN